LDAMPEKKLIAEDLERDGCVCALGAVGRKRGMDLSRTPYDPHDTASMFGISLQLASEIMYMNDEGALGDETPEQRWRSTRDWVARQIQ